MQAGLVTVVEYTQNEIKIYSETAFEDYSELEQNRFG